MTSAAPEMMTLFQMADQWSRDSDALRRDFTHAVLPDAHYPPSEEQIAHTRSALIDIVCGVEQAMLARLDGTDAERAMPAPYGLAWPVLRRSGLLTDAALIDHARTLAQYRRMFVGHNQDTAVHAHLATLAGHADTLVADAAMRHLSSLMTTPAGPEGALRTLAADQLHRLLWQIAAAYEVEGDPRAAMMRAAVPHLLADHDEGAGPLASADRLAYRLTELQDGLCVRVDAALYGLPLLLSLWGASFGLHTGELMLWTAEHGLARLTVLARAQGVETMRAMRNLLWIAQHAGHHEGALTPIADYAATDQDAATRMIRRMASRTEGALA